MRILFVADEEDKYLWDFYRPGCIGKIDLIISAGDLKGQYLSFLTTVLNRPLLYVHGNHDDNYDRFPPEGCDCVDDKLVVINGLRILGLGGSMLYNGGEFQYTEKQMQRRILRLRRKIKKAGGIDIVLTHAPVYGFGDEDNLCHMGFQCFRDLIDEFHPRYLIHGHVHRNYSQAIERSYEYNGTIITNVYKRHIIEID